MVRLTYFSDKDNNTMLSLTVTAVDSSFIHELHGASEVAIPCFTLGHMPIRTGFLHDNAPFQMVIIMNIA